jgi:S1-C subfamily serine protease
LARRFDLAQTSAVEVVAVEPGGPASQAGIEPDDLVISLGDQDVTSVDDLHKLLTQLPVGIPVSVVLLRGERRLQRFVLSEEYPHWDPAKR